MINTDFRSDRNREGKGFSRPGADPVWRSGLAELRCPAIRRFPSSGRARFSRTIASALLAGLLSAGCASWRAAELQRDYPEEKAQIERRLQEVLAAAENKDFDRLDGYHLYGPKFTKFTGSSPERLDATGGREGEHAGLGAIQGLKMRADGLKIDVFGNVGIATFILDYRFEAGGETIRRKERSTLVFVRDKRTWKIAHEHLSPIKP